MKVVICYEKWVGEKKTLSSSTMTWLKMGRKVIISIEKGKGTGRGVGVEKSGSGVSTDTNGKNRQKRK